MTQSPIPALAPNGSGHQFVFYGDSCSGVPGALHEQKLAQVNAVVRRLDPQPEFIVFPGDEVIGLVPDADELRRQWTHFLEVEMGWLDRATTPMFHSTGNHTTYDGMSEKVFVETLSHLPRNGPPDQQGLSYYVRRGDLLLIFVHTLWSGLGGEGHMETEWLAETLRTQSDARWTFVVGHHPAYPVNGFVGTYQRCIGDEYVEPFWQLLVDHGVTAYLCSHILAFDVQCHRGVLQITSAGAGTAHRMPEGIEYLHAVQMALDEQGLRYQVLDDAGTVREGLQWPPTELDVTQSLRFGDQPCPIAGQSGFPVRLALSGRMSGANPRQTILAALDHDDTCPLWIGLVGPRLQLSAVMQPIAGRSPHQWLGPCFADGDDMKLDLLIHPDMGPGGFLWRGSKTDAWTGLAGMSAWGADRLVWPERLSVGAMGAEDKDTRFDGTDLSVTLAAS
ncbi:MAG: metallophosphoesterase [Paracoccaceae bacterium]